MGINMTSEITYVDDELDSESEDEGVNINKVLNKRSHRLSIKLYKLDDHVNYFNKTSFLTGRGRFKVPDIKYHTIEEF